MIGLDASGWIVGVVVKCIEMRADLFHRREVLDHRGSALEDSTLDGP
jgi:hypothetical protein